MDMGLGSLGNSNLIFRRKFRWTFEVIDPLQYKTAPNWCKIASRPNLTIDEQEIHFLNGWMTIPGKGKWETMTVTYYDTSEGLDNLFNWLVSVYEFNAPNPQMHIRQASKPSEYAATCQLDMYDGCGNSMETWTLSRTWPQAVNFGELDYSSSEEQTIELTLRYAFVKLIRKCGIPPTMSCSPCGTN